jgi:hypothetical protein
MGYYLMLGQPAWVSERYGEWVLKNSLFISNGQNLGDKKCLAIGEDRSYRILAQFCFCEFCRNEFFNSHEIYHQRRGDQSFLMRLSGSREPLNASRNS